MKALFELYWIFLKVGLFTFGGGYTMLPILQKEIVEKRKWLATEQLIDFYSLSQCSPGVIAVNVSTYIGYSKKKYLGGIFSALGVITPSIIIITIIATVLTNFLHIEAVNHAFAGIRAAVAALVIVTIIDMYKKSIVDWVCIILYIGSFVISVFTSISPVFIVLVSAVVGLLLGTRMSERKKRDK
ncbi:MAG: chromate transporter [Clostridiaceae bacterium]|nr:chromate transporter [Clostridiaceae bacterium]